MKRYNVVINGVATTVQLSDAAAQAQGLTEVKVAAPRNKSKAPANKARSARKRADANT